MELVIVRVGFHCFGVALRVLRVLGWWMLHICACSVSAEIAKSCGTATSATTMIPLPCARTPSTHMGTRPPHTTITRKVSNRNKNQSPPHKTPLSHVQHRRQPHPQPQTGTRPMSVRKWTDLAAECDRSRCGSGPISRRSTTDLEPEYDRSRCGTGPMSVRSTTDLGDGGGGRSRVPASPALARRAPRAVPRPPRCAVPTCPPATLTP